MNLINEMITRQGLELSRKLDNLVMARLLELGYDIYNLEEAVERLSIVRWEHNPLRELWMDRGKVEEQLIAYFTDTVIKQEDVNSYSFTVEFKFGPMPKTG